MDVQEARDPRDLALKLIQQDMRRAVTDMQAACSHYKGAVTLPVGVASTSIAWHTFDDGIERGVCTNCLKRFDPTIDVAEYRIWRHKWTTNTPSRAGIEQPLTVDEKKESHENDTFCVLDQYV